MRRLRRNHSTATPGEVVIVHVAFDEPQPSLGMFQQTLGFLDGHAMAWRYEKGERTRQDEHSFDCRESFWDWLDLRMTKSRPVWLIGYGIARMIWALGFGELLDDERFTIFRDGPGAAGRGELGNGNPTERGLLVSSDPPVIIDATNQAGGKLIVCDLRNWINASLDHIRTDVNRQHAALLETPVSSASSPIGARDSCAIVAAAFDSVVEWVRGNGLGKFRYTAASQSMAAYRHRFISFEITLHDSRTVQALESLAYYGAEFAAFALGRIHRSMRLIDACGFYPSLMLTNKFPIKLLEHRHFGNAGRERVDCDPAKSLATVLVNTTRNTYPVRFPDGTWHCSGRFITTLPGPELSRAYRNGEIERWYEIAEYATAPAFTDYISWLWSHRLFQEFAGRDVFRTLAKVLANSFYGKWGQKTAQWEFRPDRIATHRWGEWRERDAESGTAARYRGIAGQTQREADRVPSSQAFVAIAAWVTSYARIRMQRIRNDCWPGRAYYQAADSLIVDGTAYRELKRMGRIASDSLGKWRVQAADRNGCVIDGVNSCRIGSKIIRSGLTVDAVRQSDGTWIDQREESLNQLLGRQPDGTWTRQAMRLAWDRHSIRMNATSRADIAPWRLGFEGTELQSWLSKVASVSANRSASSAQSLPVPPSNAS